MCVPWNLLFHFLAKFSALGTAVIEIALFHSPGNPRARTLACSFVLKVFVITSPTN